MQTVAIYGAGLIGGSFALALRAAGFGGRILGVSSAATAARAVELGIVDEAASASAAAAEADLLYLAQPIGRILELLPTLEAHVRPDALVTDAGSTKSAIVEVASRTLTRCHFLGGHPMAGKETRGVDAAEANLFRERTYVLTPRSPAEMNTPQAQNLLKWVRAIGAQPVLLDAAEHDRLVAYTSHLPQLASTALAAALLEKHADALPPVWGPALLDSTRLALSPFDVWGDILATNREQVTEALDAYIRELVQIKGFVGETAMSGVFDRAASLARTIRKPN